MTEPGRWHSSELDSNIWYTQQARGVLAVESAVICPGDLLYSWLP